MIEPPQPFLTPAELTGVDQETIDAVVGEIDGPDGWLGRAIGAQTLEWVLDDWRGRNLLLPCAPIIDILSVVYTDTKGIEQTVDSINYGKTGDYLWFKPAWHMPSLGSYPEPVRIRYRAGYDSSPVADGGTGPIPAQIRKAVKLVCQYVQAIGKDDLFLQVDEVEGVGRRQYIVSDVAAKIIRDAADQLLSGLRHYA
ncbi:hypothetical protein [Rhizobium sp. SG570]|uniref:hypothetical protein n=1 Tax=Rhizobium sp. SG570 TaxID=2587113 RepID=UPI001447E67F|nr:hypothetical protein [Rhizobium sp. SG570]NKJ34114.1 hypothetical protein [Rhizobium sp. SG570]